MEESKYSDFLRSLANKLDENDDNIEEVCDDLLEIIFAEMTLNEIFSFIVSKYAGQVTLG